MYDLYTSRLQFISRHNESVEINIVFWLLVLILLYGTRAAFIVACKIISRVRFSDVVDINGAKVLKEKIHTYFNLQNTN